MFSILGHSRLAVLVFALAGCAGGLSIEPPTFDSSVNDNDDNDNSSSDNSGSDSTGY